MEVAGGPGVLDRLGERVRGPFELVTPRGEHLAQPIDVLVGAIADP